MQKRTRERNSQGIRVARESRRINHLVFADDTMFFCRINNRSIESLKQILRDYERASGQLNHFLQKSSPRLEKQSEKKNSKYISTNKVEYESIWGYQSIFWKKKRDIFTSIVDMIKQKALSWSTKFLSNDRKLVLLKSVLAVMPYILCHVLF